LPYSPYSPYSAQEAVLWRGHVANTRICRNLTATVFRSGKIRLGRAVDVMAPLWPIVRFVGTRIPRIPRSGSRSLPCQCRIDSSRSSPGLVKCAPIMVSWAFRRDWQRGNKRSLDTVGHVARSWKAWNRPASLETRRERAVVLSVIIYLSRLRALTNYD